jgi:hypothetical protein
VEKISLIFTVTEKWKCADKRELWHIYIQIWNPALEGGEEMHNNGEMLSTD